MDGVETTHARVVGRWLELLGLSGFAFAQPLLDIVAREADFLVVHGTTRGGLLTWLALWVLVPPTLCFILTQLAGAVSPVWSRRGHLLAVGAMVALALLVPFSRLLSDLPAALAAAGIGLAVPLLWNRWRWLRGLVGISWLAVPVFAGVFLLAPGVRPLWTSPAPSTTSSPGTQSAGDNPSVFLLVLDEVPLPSLLNGEGEIDPHLYPNFADLAAESTWFPNATTVSGATLRSVSAMVSGRYPGWRQAPTVEEFPRTLFTLLESSHDLIVYESSTQLSPSGSIEDGRPPRFRFRTLLADSAVLYGHIVLPARIRGQLPSVSHRWANFTISSGPSGAGVETRVDRFRRFIDAIESGPRPVLGFAHSLVTHSPYKFLPDGSIQCWCETPGLDDGVWADDPRVVTEAYRRHLTQLMCGDRLLGEFLDRLRDEGLYDDALVIVVSDHGASFRPGENIRVLSATNPVDLMSIPLFVKEPGQSSGRRDERFAQTIDLLPTVLEILGRSPGWELEGRSLARPWSTDRSSLVFLNQGQRRRERFPTGRLQQLATIVASKVAQFGHPRGLSDLYGWNRPGLGRDLDDLQWAQHPHATGSLARPDAYRSVVPEDRFVPARVDGVVVGLGAEPTEILVAIAGVTRAYGPLFAADSQGARAFAVTVPPGSFHDGANRVDLLVQAGGGTYFRVFGQSASYVGVVLGTRPLPAVLEAGFHTAEAWDSEPMRWTDGRAWLQVPLDPTDRPTTLRLDLAATGPVGTHLRLLVDGVMVFAGKVRRGAWSRDFAVRPSGDRMRIQIESDTFVPAEIGDSEDHRRLGVAVKSLILQSEE